MRCYGAKIHGLTGLRFNLVKARCQKPSGQGGLGKSGVMRHQLIACAN